MKKIYSLLSVLVLTLTAFAQTWDGISRTTWTTGDGTATNPYLIETPENLVYLSDMVAGGETFAGKFFRLAANLDMGSKEFPAIGKFDKGTNSATGQEEENSLYFLGVLDGDYKTIDNLLITKAPATTGAIGDLPMSLGGVGLFACANTGTIIRNLIIGAGSVVNVESDVVGAFIGKMEGGILENCANLGTVNGSSMTGGLVGAMTGSSTIRHSVNKGVVATTGMMASGIVSQMEKNAQVVGCYNTGAVNGASFYTGGILGLIWDNSVVSNVYNIGKVSGGSTFMGAPQAIVSDVDGDSFRIEKAFYVQALTVVDDHYGTGKTADEMKADDILTALNTGIDGIAFVKDEAGINNGFPILSWETGVVNGISDLKTVNPAKATTGNAVVRDLSGKMVATGANALPAKAGIYLVSRPGQPTVKVIVK